MRQGKQRQNKVRLTYSAPGKHGKLETREFASQEEAMAYIERNTMPKHRLAGVTAFQFGYGHGLSSSPSVRKVEIYDPRTGNFTP